MGRLGGKYGNEKRKLWGKEMSIKPLTCKNQDKLKN